MQVNTIWGVRLKVMPWISVGNRLMNPSGTAMKRESSWIRPWSSNWGPSRESLRALTRAKTCATVSPKGSTICKELEDSVLQSQQASHAACGNLPDQFRDIQHSTSLAADVPCRY